VVLVHGAVANASSWSEVIKLLHGAGITVTAVRADRTTVADKELVRNTAECFGWWAQLGSNQ
jgi:hypothetical protein